MNHLTLTPPLVLAMHVPPCVIMPINIMLTISEYDILGHFIIIVGIVLLGRTLLPMSVVNLKLFSMKAVTIIFSVFMCVVYLTLIVVLAVSQYYYDVRYSEWLYLLFGASAAAYGYIAFVQINKNK